MTRILKISAPLVAALLIAAAIGSSHAARPGFGLSPNGISPNGISPNGVSPNGVASPGAQVKTITLPNGASYSAR